MSNAHHGLFIVFEGGEGSGKSTQAAKLANALELHGIPTHLTREPGDTPLGKELRRILLDRNGEPISQKTEALLFAADRAEHVQQVIKPKLEQGVVVICDRYIASTLAYQSYAGGLDKDMIDAMSDWASDGLYPDITYFLDVDPVVGLERARKGEQTRFEDKSIAYHTKVRNSFRDQRNDSWVTIDARRFIDEVHQEILNHTLHIVRVLQRFKPEGMLKATPVISKIDTFSHRSHMEDLSDMAQYGLQSDPVRSKSTAGTTCGRAGCIDHPISPRVVSIDGGY